MVGVSCLSELSGMGSNGAQGGFAGGRIRGENAVPAGGAGLAFEFDVSEFVRLQVAEQV